MAHDEHAVLLAKLDKSIGRREVVPRWFRMHKRPLQNILRSNRIEMGLYDLGATHVFLKDLTAVKCSADLEVVFEDVLESFLFLRHRRQAHCQATKKHKDHIRMPIVVPTCAFLWPTSQRLRV